MKLTMRSRLTTFLRDADGQDLIEYALLAALIGLATTLAMKTLATSISTEFGDIGSSVTGGS